MLVEHPLEIGWIDAGELPATDRRHTTDIDRPRAAEDQPRERGLVPMRAITRVRPVGHDEGVTTVIIAPWTFSVLPLVENSVWSAPASAKSSIAVSSPCQDWWQLSTPLPIPISAWNA